MFNTTGKRVRLLKGDLEYNSTELREKMKAVGVDISSGYMSEIENDKKLPSRRVLEALAEVLGTTVDYLLLRTEEPFPAPNVKEPNTLYLDDNIDADVVQRMIDVFASLSRADQEMLIGMAQRLRAVDTPRIIGSKPE